ncbi:SusD-like starch-binding protein associating with outer membrane [Dyadobacter jejuensis]|uniref:SusD-like starch-binding protein associating with outer membrane n=1 Tax=Dyadobacter jejuensis TaxID=1082580 RepID=A0A316AS40_9BACT|nr:SusD/RagB family nutrient-binding outer membrane lipoprotein [Dyadobacter jejuensis]PWJ60084.1 SusD-like starch-binding protein associating with outer membrane [Dyadobacter jejuensis]
MKTFNKIIFSTSLLLLGGLTACDKQDFVDINVDPDALSSIPPENQFLNASRGIHGQDFEAFYDFYTRIMPWMQYATGVNGNQGAFTTNMSNFSSRYGALYSNGAQLYDIEKLVERMEADVQPRYVHMIRIARILKAYYAFYVSDIYGSIPYSEAFQARYGGTLTPAYDTQQALFARLDAEIKEAVSVLKQTQSAPQVTLGDYDGYYNGSSTQWVKAGNALRLKIALRQIKVDPSTATSIINEIVAMPETDLMTTQADGWVFTANQSFTSGGNWNPASLRATKPMVDFMYENKDPRLDAFVAPNTYTQANIDLLIADNQLPAGTTEASRRYLGSFTSPDQASSPAIKAQYYATRTVRSGDLSIVVDTLSYLQPRLFRPSETDANGVVGSGLVFIPVITYSEYCFMRAEIAARGIGSGTKDWYEKGVKSSIDWYDMIGIDSKLTNYTPVKEAEVEAYMQMPAVAFDASKALDQIASQAYLHFLKQPAEGWALWKRTGFPNATSSVMLPVLTNNNAVLTLPRRAPLSLLNENDQNYTNQKAAYDAMATLPGFGKDPQDATGRVWWDKP